MGFGFFPGEERPDSEGESRPGWQRARQNHSFVNTTEGSIGKVYVSANGGLELLFADGHRGSALAHWIETGFTYEFL